MESFGAYSHALFSVALFALLTLALNAATGYLKGAAGMVPGAAPAPDYGNRLYRISRAYQNTSETLGVFTAVVLVCVVAGAAPFWVNLLASLGFLSRVAMAWVHVQGIGKADGGLRSILFAVGFFINVGLGVLGALAAL